MYRLTRVTKIENLYVYMTEGGGQHFEQLNVYGTTDISKFQNSKY